MFYGFDLTYFYIVLPCVLLAMAAQSGVSRTFKRYSRQFNARGLTGAQAAMAVLQKNGVSNVRVEHIQGVLTDHYDPRSNVIRLSDDVYASTSTAAIGVACHEAGHAVQYARNYFPIRLRAAIIPVTNIGSRLAMPLIILGILMNFLGEISYYMVDLGLICFGLSALFQLLTLPVEFDASHRALAAIEENELLNQEERVGARRTLTAAALTYVAALAVALAQLLRLVMLFGHRRSDN